MNTKALQDEAQMTISPTDQLAINKAGNIDGWMPYYYRRVENGVLVRGCMTTKFTRGPRKGKIKFLTREMEKTIVIDDKELAAMHKIVGRSI